MNPTTYTEAQAIEAWVCVRKNNHSIPDDALDSMKAVLLAALHQQAGAAAPSLPRLTFDQCSEIAQELNLPGAGVVQGVLNAAFRIAERDGVKAGAGAGEVMAWQERAARMGCVVSLDAEPTTAIEIALCAEIADLRAQLASAQQAKEYEQRHAAESETALAQAHAQLARQRQDSKPTDLSKRLREYGESGDVSDRELLVQAADEIERYYGGMLAWKRTAEAKDAEFAAAQAQGEPVAKPYAYAVEWPNGSADLLRSKPRVEFIESWRAKGAVVHELFTKSAAQADEVVSADASTVRDAWISVDERLPQTEGWYPVLIGDPDGIGWATDVWWRAEFRKGEWSGCDPIEDGQPVTHWIDAKALRTTAADNQKG